MKDRDVIDGRWKVAGEQDYSGPTKTPQEEVALFRFRLGRLFVWAFTAAGVLLVTSCAHFIASQM